MRKLKKVISLTVATAVMATGMNMGNVQVYATMPVATLEQTFPR